MQTLHHTRDRWRFLRTLSFGITLSLMLGAFLPAPVRAQTEADTAGAVIALPNTDEMVAETTAEISAGIKGDLKTVLAGIDAVEAKLSDCLSQAARSGTVGGPQSGLSPLQLQIACSTDYRTQKIGLLQQSQGVYFTLADLSAQEAEQIGGLIGEARNKREGFAARQVRAREGAQVLFDAHLDLLTKDPASLTPEESALVAEIQRQLRMASLELETAVVVTAKFDKAITKMEGLADYLGTWSRSAREQGLDIDVALHAERLAIETLAIDTDLAAIWDGPSAMPSILGDLTSSLTDLQAFKADPAGLADTTAGTELAEVALPPIPSDDPVARQAELMAAFAELGVTVPKEQKPEAVTPAAAEEGLGQ
jgi:hypothetical protein